MRTLRTDRTVSTLCSFTGTAHARGERQQWKPSGLRVLSGNNPAEPHRVAPAVLRLKLLQQQLCDMRGVERGQQQQPDERKQERRRA